MVGMEVKPQERESFNVKDNVIYTVSRVKAT